MCVVVDVLLKCLVVYAVLLVNDLSLGYDCYLWLRCIGLSGVP